jgi:hypothetical protein
MDKYNKVIEILKKNKPILEEKERLTEQIMNSLQKPENETKMFQEKLSFYLFGWADVKWVRGAMAVAATFLIGIFIIQQVAITDRINSLEEQLVKTVSTMQDQEPNLGIMQKVLLNVVAKDQIEEDSITVSRADLEELMDSYMELKNDYDEVKDNRRLESFIKRRIRQNLDKGEDNAESEFEL